MPRTVLGAATRYAARGNTPLLWIPKAAMSDGNLTTAILDATTTVDLTCSVAAMSGFNATQADMPAGDWCSQKIGTVPGDITLAESSLTFYLSKNGSDDVREVLHTDDEGYLLIADGGLVAGNLADLCHVTVKYGTKVREDVARITVPFSVGNIDENVVIPALS